MLHSQQVVAGGDAGTAVGHDLRRTRHTDRGEAGTQLPDGQETACGVEVLPARQAARTGDVARAHVHRVVLATEAVGGPGGR